MVSLGLEPGVARWKAQTNSLSLFLEVVAFTLKRKMLRYL